MNAALTLVAALFATLAAAPPAAAASLADLAFLKGNWVSDRSGFVIEESWTDARAGVLVGLSRGVQADAVRFLRFAIIEQSGDSVVMRFKRYNPDYSSWEADGPSVMTLTSADRGRIIFDAADPEADVQRIAYQVNRNGTVAVTANRRDEQGPYLVAFTLRRTAGR